MNRICFNTKRGYTKFGQRITATLHADDVVTFHDHDRMISGQFTLAGQPFNQQTVMAAYDSNTIIHSQRAWQDAFMSGACNADYVG